MHLKKIRLLDFFRTGKLASVEIGMPQEAVFAEMGQPDRWIDEDGKVNKSPFVATQAIIWGYEAIELCWLKPETGLHMISFSVDALHWPSPTIKIDQWIFHKSKSKSWTRSNLKSALDKAEIPYRDTGLEIVVCETDDPFGTLVLNSGVQVRYGQDDHIIKVSMPGRWLFKGTEPST